MIPEELRFLAGSRFFDAVPEEAVESLVGSMQLHTVKAGERFITQGEPGDTLYIIQEGRCTVSVEKDNEMHITAHLRQGDLVGEMAVITGEPRAAHVVAETDMILRGIPRERFDAVCESHPDLREFLTEVVADRFATSNFTADRNIGKYVIKGVLGKGGWSIVYRGIHRDLHVPVAIKMLKHDMAMNPFFAGKFKQEAKTIARLNHPNIVKVYDIEHLYRTIFIVMEYLPGVSLRELLAGMPRQPMGKILEILLQACSALAYAHESGIIHQDVKPDNLFILPNGEAKLVDFGVACTKGAADASLLGTMRYSAPEQLAGAPPDERTDIYSLGITAFEMVNGRRPVLDEDAPPSATAPPHMDDPGSLRDDLPEELHRFLARSMQKTPEARYSHVQEAMADLAPLASRMGVSTCPHSRESDDMMALLISYQDEQRLALKELVEEFSEKLKKTGARLRVSGFREL